MKYRCNRIINVYLLLDYRRYELAYSKVDHTHVYTIGHLNRICKIGRVRILHCGKHRPEDDKHLA